MRNANLPLKDVVEPALLGRGLVATPGLSENALELLIEATHDPHGQVICARTMRGTTIQTNGRTFGETGNARSEAEWTAAIEDLVTLDLLQPVGARGEVFSVTHSGFTLAEEIRRIGKRLNATGRG